MRTRVGRTNRLPVALTLAAALAAACENGPFDVEDPEPIQVPASSSADVTQANVRSPDYVTRMALGVPDRSRGVSVSGMQAGSTIILAYQDEMPWFGLNRAHATLVAAPPAGNGKILGDDYFIHPLSDLALGIPDAASVVLITSNSSGSSAQAATQNSPASQGALSAFLARGGTLIVDMGDNLSPDGFMAPGAAGTPDLVFPSPADNATLVAGVAGHGVVVGPDGVAGGGDDLDDDNIDACCSVAHGNLEDGLTLPVDAVPIMTAGFGGVQKVIMAEYCVGPGLVILDTNTKEYSGQQPRGSGPGFVMRNLFSYALRTQGTACVIPVEIDIKPGDYANPINLKSKGVVPVAILGSADFDVTDVDVTTLTFGPAGTAPAHDLTNPARHSGHLEDVNRDGYMDLVSHYRQKQTALTVADTEACIEGATLGGTPIKGCDSVRILGG